MIWEAITVTSEPLTLAETKAHLRLLTSDISEDTYLNSLISAARDFSENYVGRSIALQTIKARTIKEKEVRLPRGPVISVVEVRVNGVATQDYTYADGIVSFTEKKEKIEVTYTAGMSSCPALLKQAILMLLANWYENREAVVLGALTSVTPSLGAVTILNQYKEWWF